MASAETDSSSFTLTYLLHGLVYGFDRYEFTNLRQRCAKKFRDRYCQIRCFAHATPRALHLVIQIH